VVGYKVFEKKGSTVELSVVIDGHGGSQTAAFLERELPSTVSRLCTQRASALEPNFAPSDEWNKLLKDAFQKCSDDWDRSASSHQEKRAGAVTTMILVCGQHCLVAHVGDGKVIASSGETYKEVTADHRADNPREKLRIENCGGTVVNNRVRGVLAPSRAFGDILVRMDANGNVNSTMIRPEPEVVPFHVSCPGFVVLGTDGLFDVVSCEVVSTAVTIFLAGNCDAAAAARYLAEHAAKRTDDDITVIVLMWSTNAVVTAAGY
jgi:serine/threonine protein phosphatase PrpC